MPRIVILGSSPSGAKLIEAIRRDDTSSPITLIALDGHYPSRRDVYAEFIGKSIAPDQVFYRPKDFYTQNGVELILDQKVSRINVNRKKITLDDKRAIEYDVLVVTDTPENRYPQIKGTNKNCVYAYKKLRDVDGIVNAFSLIKTVVIQSRTFTGLQAAGGFVKSGVEAIVVAPENGFLARHFDGEAAEWLMPQLETLGLRVLCGNPIKEILGDKDAKAVRLQSGKVFSAEAVLFMETEEDMRLFSSSVGSTGLFEVDEHFRTSAEGVFALDLTNNRSGIEPVTPLPILEAQGEVVAASIKGLEISFEPPVCVRTLSLEGLRITVIGDTESGTASSDQPFDKENGTFKQLFIKDDHLIGAILINLEDEAGSLVERIRNREVSAPQPLQDQPQNESEMTDESGENDEANVSAELVDK